MFNKPLILLPFAFTTTLSQSVWFTFYTTPTCTLDGFAGNCQGFGADECCSGAFFTTPFFQSLDTENWDNVPSGSLAVGFSDQGCNSPVGAVIPGFCLAGGSSSIGGASLVTGGNPLRKRDDAGCKPVPINALFFTPGDGFKYTVNATAHRANLEHMSTAQAVEEYIVENFDEKTPV